MARPFRAGRSKEIDVDYLTFVETKQQAGYPAQVILDQLVAYWRAEAAERDAALDLEMTRATDRLTELATTFGYPAERPF